jgi:hypothetical protein
MEGVVERRLIRPDGRIAIPAVRGALTRLGPARGGARPGAQAEPRLHHGSRLASVGTVPAVRP